MLFRYLPFLILSGATVFAANPTQPMISSGGVVNAASYLSPNFANAGIARGSLFLIFGNYLGPDTLVQATTFPLPTSSGLGGTRVHIYAGTYQADVPLVYTSVKQVAAILPSDVPLGDVSLTLSYNTVSSNPALIHVVQSAFGIFTLNQGGTGQAVVQNFTNQIPLPVNTIISSASPGQTETLWGTGLGPVSGGDEAAGPLPGALPYLDALYVGGQRANVRFAGRSSCCAGIDQINFEVPAGVSGCYVPVVAVASGKASNVATMAISPNQECDDPLSFRSSDLLTLERTGVLRLGSIGLWTNDSPPSESVNASFVSYKTAVLTVVPVPLNSSAGSCYETQEAVNPGAQSVSYGDPLNAGVNVAVRGPSGTLTLQNPSPGIYSASLQTSGPFTGAYAVTSPGGLDIQALQGSFTVGPPLQWTNASSFTATPLPIGQALGFKWTPGDINTYVKVQILASTATVKTSIVCDVRSDAGGITVPDYLARTIPQGSAAISLSTFSVQHGFSGQGLDAGIVTAGSTNTVQANFYSPLP